MNKGNKPRRKAGNTEYTPVPFTRAHSERVKYTGKEQRREAKKEAREWNQQQ
jgi:hypothetical protein